MKKEVLARIIGYPILLAGGTGYSIGIERLFSSDHSPLSAHLLPSAAIIAVFGAIDFCETRNLHNKYAAWLGHTLYQLSGPSLKTELKKMNGKEVGDLEDIAERLKRVNWKQLIHPSTINLNPYC